MTKTYTTISGDMWDGIAYKAMGSELYRNQLLACNMRYRETYVFPAGVVLTVPEVEPEVSAKLPAWKRVAL